jgi:hypothetical protein
MLAKAVEHKEKGVAHLPLKAEPARTNRRSATEARKRKCKKYLKWLVDQKRESARTRKGKRSDWRVTEVRLTRRLSGEPRGWLTMSGIDSGTKTAVQRHVKRKQIGKRMWWSTAAQRSIICATHKVSRKQARRLTEAADHARKQRGQSKGKAEVCQKSGSKRKRTEK